MGSIAALEIFEAVDGHAARCASGELQQMRLAFCWRRMQRGPEPLDHPDRLLVTAVVRESRPVVCIDLGHPTNRQLELVLSTEKAEVPPLDK